EISRPRAIEPNFFASRRSGIVIGMRDPVPSVVAERSKENRSRGDHAAGRSDTRLKFAPQHIPFPRVLQTRHVCRNTCDEHIMRIESQIACKQLLEASGE